MLVAIRLMFKTCFMDDFGKTLRALRLGKGWRQYQLADAVGVSVQAVSQWERGLNYPEMGRLKIIADVLGTSVSFLATDVIAHDDPKIVTTAFDIVHIPIIKATEVGVYLRGAADNNIKLDNVVGVRTDAHGKMFGVEIIDERMSPFLQPGDIAIFDSGVDRFYGDCVIVITPHRVDAVIGTYRFAAYMKDKEIFHIVPINDAYDVIELEEPGFSGIMAVLVERHSFFGIRRGIATKP